MTWEKWEIPYAVAVFTGGWMAGLGVAPFIGCGHDTLIIGVGLLLFGIPMYMGKCMKILHDRIEKLEAEE